MFPHLLRFVLGVEDCEFGEHAHVGTLEAERRFQELDELLKVTPVLVVGDQLL